MTFWAIILTGLGLSMDAFAVALTNGMCVRESKVRDAIKLGLYFGFFQAFMPVVGWAAGRGFSYWVAGLGHWIAFVLLGFVGGKMIYESVKSESINKEEAECECSAALSLSDDGAARSNPGRDAKNRFNHKSLLAFAFATSIDALAVGVSFAFLHLSILNAALTIGALTFVISTIGVGLGKRCGAVLGTKTEIIGGIILIGIGIKILLAHGN